MIEHQDEVTMSTPALVAELAQLLNPDAPEAVLEDAARVFFGIMICHDAISSAVNASELRIKRLDLQSRTLVKRDIIARRNKEPAGRLTARWLRKYFAFEDINQTMMQDLQNGMPTPIPHRQLPEETPAEKRAVIADIALLLNPANPDKVLDEAARIWKRLYAVGVSHTASGVHPDWVSECADDTAAFIAERPETPPVGSIVALWLHMLWGNPNDIGEVIEKTAGH